MCLDAVRHELRNLADPRHAESARRFFKTGPGQYGEGDIFIGIRVPLLRKLSKKYQSLPMESVLGLLASPIHEERLVALLIWILQFKKTGMERRKEIYHHYLANTRHINSWDLVDATAPHIVGHYLMHRDKAPLYRLAESENLWERRISILSTFYFIKKNRFEDTLGISKRLLEDCHDLIHKAVGWMLREVGKRDRQAAEVFLKRHYSRMPRTMLRYAIERFPETRRQAYLKGAI